MLRAILGVVSVGIAIIIQVLTIVIVVLSVKVLLQAVNFGERSRTYPAIYFEVWLARVTMHQMFKKARTLVTSAGEITKVTRKSNTVVVHVIILCHK
jgi:hypothetical protein